jgi:hypothetical protein
MYNGIGDRMNQKWLEEAKMAYIDCETFLTDKKEESVSFILHYFTGKIDSIFTIKRLEKRHRTSLLLEVSFSLLNRYFHLENVHNLLDLYPERIKKLYNFWYMDLNLENENIKTKRLVSLE